MEAGMFFKLLFIIILARLIWHYLLRPLMEDARRSAGGPGRRQGENLHYLSMLMPLVARIAKSDGRVSEEEIAFVERLFVELRLSHEEMTFAKHLFMETKDQPETFDEALYRFRQSRYSFEVRWLTFQMLVNVACAENAGIDATKQQLLRLAAQAFSIPMMLVDQILGRTTHFSSGYQRERFQSRSQGASFSHRAHDLMLLGLKEGASKDEIKRAYRQKVKELHPDRLHAEGLPEAMIRKATDRMAEINAAYDRLMGK